MQELNIYKNDFESIVIEWRGKQVGYITKGKRYVLTIYLEEYFADLKHRNTLTAWIYQILKHKEYEAYSIVKLENKGFKIIG